LPARFAVDSRPLPVAVGKVTCIRLVAGHAQISILGEVLKLGKRLKFQYVKATWYTEAQMLKVYHHGRLVKQFSEKIRKR